MLATLSNYNRESVACKASKIFTIWSFIEELANFFYTEKCFEQSGAYLH